MKSRRDAGLSKEICVGPRPSFTAESPRTLRACNWNGGACLVGQGGQGDEQQGSLSLSWSDRLRQKGQEDEIGW